MNNQQKRIQQTMDLLGVLLIILAVHLLLVLLMENGPGQEMPTIPTYFKQNHGYKADQIWDKIMNIWNQPFLTINSM